MNHRIAAAKFHLPPPEDGSLRQAAQACVKRLQADSALKMNIQSARKRPFPDKLAVFLFIVAVTLNLPEP